MQSKSLEAVQQIVATLEEEILLGRLYPRERLIEDQLTERFGQKRHVVRQALSDLEIMGLVVREAGKGAVVREYSPEEVNSLYQMREVVEAAAANMIDLPVKEEDYAKIRKICEQYADAVEKNDMKTVIDCNKRFHREVYCLCGNPFLIDVIENMAQRSNLVRFTSSRDRELLHQARDEHFGILEALAETDNQALAKLCVDHMQPSRQRYLERHQ